MDSHAPLDGPKPSRYRSVRQQQNSTPPPSQADSPSDTVHRSRSRYHHKQHPVTNASASPAEHSHSPDDNATREDMQNIPPRRQLSSRDGTTSDRYRGRHAQSSDATPGAQDTTHHTSHHQPLRPAEDDERRRALQDKYGRRMHPDDLTSPERRRTESPRPDHPTNKPDPRFDQAPQRIQARKEGAIGPQDEVISDDEANPGCFSGLFKRKRVDPIKNIPEKIPSAKVASSKSKAPPPTIKPHGGGIVPGTDAPVSASNAGDRRVLVECNKSSMLLPVTTETTAMDLINSAANVFSDQIDVRASVLLEHFGNVGVQRPLRRYERVREVMNSWDDDRANSLLVVPTRAADVNPAGLSASNAPTTSPAESSFLMQYSQKVGSWDKRLITIRQDGQIVMTKDAKNKDPTYICHLSDYDIYTPTAKQMAKKIKPPKKFCYAIKSQQKASMFETTSAFVHFFCHADKTHATSFYDAVQSWRSWYLVHVLGEGQKKPASSGLHHSPSKRVNTKAPGGHAHHNTSSSIGSHYQLGSFKPMTVDMNQFDRPSSSHSQAAGLQQQQQQQQQQTAMSQIPSRKLSTRDRTAPPSAFPKHMQLADDEPLVNLAVNRRGSFEVHDRDDAAFTATGLLGRSYSTRRREQQDRDDAAKNPFTSSGLVNGAGETGVARQVSIKRAGSKRVQSGGPGLAHRPSTREGSAPRRTGSIDLGRSGSTRKPVPKPLIDLTPQYQPPPQHVKKGRGYKPTAEELRTGPLIEAATSGEKTWRDEIPEAKDWRGRANNADAAGAAQQTRPRSRSRSAQHGHAGQGATRYASPAGATDPYGPPPPASSRGNRNFSGASGSPAAAPSPLIDVSEASNFAKGSLLNRLERENPRPGPVIDREA